MSVRPAPSRKRYGLNEVLFGYVYCYHRPGKRKLRYPELDPSMGQGSWTAYNARRNKPKRKENRR
jgi:hypothetical protein